MAHVIPREADSAGPELIQSLRDYALARLPRAMCPVRLVFCDTLPRTVTGKIKRRALREMPDTATRPLPGQPT